MKKFFILSIYLIGVNILFQGCSKQLEEVDIRVPSGDTYYATANGFNDLINACYTHTRTHLDGNGIAMDIYGADLWTHASDIGANEFNSYLPTLNATSSILYNYWSGYYLGIADCNTAITRQETVTDMAPDLLKAKVGEAYFLRAWYYSKLVMQFGDLPLVTQEVTGVETTATRSSVDEVYSLIVSDLKTAESYLPAKQPDFGRVAKSTAEAELARIYLILNKNDSAAFYAKKVIEEYNFSLLPDYGEIFKPGNENNSEIIWSIQYSVNTRESQPSQNIHLFFTPRYDLHPGMTRALNYDRPYPRYMATRFYLDLMQNNRWKDSRYDKSWREVYIANYAPTLPPGMKIGDTAYMVVPYEVPQSVKDSKPYPIFDINFYYNGDKPTGALEIYPALTKYVDPFRSSINANDGTRDITEIRIAEMYFIAAEAYMKMGQNSEGVKYMNTVLRRAAWPGHESDMEISPDELTLDFILDQYALEFGGELMRWETLKRTGKLLERAREYNTEAAPRIQEYHLLRPIPQVFIDRLTNKSEFKQNPGY